MSFLLFWSGEREDGKLFQQEPTVRIPEILQASSPV